ncbi:hypothetical protein [Legionella maioricensis]|uniref:MFS transporter n=1 Tax=Legionella maioricensis TaxID=2896528 RepID=A0A9X2D3J1_9GAMM|nr:hypothetical protein [Legionella maioricensis]MCL9685395.1 hypothetical protein [Legionella maioricensis]
MQANLFYLIWGMKLLCTVSIRVILYTILFVAAKHSAHLNSYSWVGVAVNFFIIIASLLTYKMLDKFLLRHVFQLVVLSQFLAILLLSHVGINIKNIYPILIIISLFILNTIETSLFDKSIKVLLPENIWSVGISLSLVITALSYIMSPLLANFLQKIILPSQLCWITIVFLTLYFIVLHFIKNNKKAEITSNQNLSDFFHFKLIGSKKIVIQLLLSFSIATVWINFMTLLAIPIVSVYHSQQFISIVLAFSGTGLLFGAISLSFFSWLPCNSNGLLFCVLSTIGCIFIFLLFCDNYLICLLSAFSGSVLSYWAYGLSQKISQTKFDSEKLAGFYTLRGACSAFLLIIFYVVNIFFSENLTQLSFSIIGYLTAYSLIYTYTYISQKYI